MTVTSLENRVEEMLHSSLEHYGQMNLLADQMLSDDSLSPRWHEAAERLSQICVRLEVEERNNRALTEDLQRAELQKSDAIRALKERLASQMQSFLMKVVRLEQTATKSKEALLPQIQAGVRAVQMKNAYGKYS